MKIAILGTGAVSNALGDRLTTTGHAVAIGSRTPEAHPGTFTHADAVHGAEVVITAVPGIDVMDTLENIGAEALGDKVILDVSAPLTPEFTLAFPNDSLARQLQERFPGARFVKSLNTMNVSVMIDPLASLPYATVFTSGNDEAAKATINSLLVDLGWRADDIFDLGGIETAMASEHAAPLFFTVFMKLQNPTFNISIAH